MTHATHPHNLLVRYWLHFVRLVTASRDGMNPTWFEVKERLWRRLYMNPRNWLKYGDRNFPCMFTFETQTVCNRRCAYCPNHDAPMEFGMMTWPVVEKMAQRMKEIDFAGFVVFSSFSEPLMDLRLTEIVKLFKREAPKCRPAIFTNADYLDADKCRELIAAGISYIHITRHPPFSKSWDEKVTALRKQFPKHIEYRGVLEGRKWLFNFAGTVPNPPGADSWARKPCKSVQWNVTIYANGDFPLCANLPEKKPVIGSLLTHSVMDIWNSRKAQTLRAQATSGTPTLDVCKACYDRSENAHITHLPRLKAAQALFPNAKPATPLSAIPRLVKEFESRTPHPAPRSDATFQN